MGIWSWLFGSDREERAENKVDSAVDMTFPASDPVASGETTSTEPPRRPKDREAPVVSKEEIEQARRGSGHKENS